MLIAFTAGTVPLDVWLAAAAEEQPVHGTPVGCRACPLRPGGELEAGLTAAFAEGPNRWGLRRWGCHTSSRPCAGMRQMLEVRPPSGSGPARG